MPAETSNARGWRWAALSLALVVAAGVAVWGLWPRPAATAAHTPDPEAVRLMQLANFAGNAGRTQVETGLRYMEEAVRRDPLYAQAWSGLATAHLVRIWFGEAPAVDTYAQVKREAQEAIRLDASRSAPWRVLGSVSHFGEWNHSQAETHFRKAIELNPKDAVALSWFGDVLTDLRRFDEARLYYRRAQDVAPRWLEPIAFAGTTLLFTGKPEMAIVEYKRVLELEPNYGLANHYLGRALIARGSYDEGIAQLRKSNELLGEVPWSLGDLGYALAKGGKRAEAEALRDHMLRRREKGYYPAFPIAATELGLGHTDVALDWLERAAQERNVGFYLPSVDITFDGVRTHPRFIALLRRMGLP